MFNFIISSMGPTISDIRVQKLPEKKNTLMQE